MARKQAKRRKQKKVRTFTLPKIRIGRIVAPLVVELRERFGELALTDPVDLLDTLLVGVG